MIHSKIIYIELFFKNKNNYIYNKRILYYIYIYIYI
jgi:hypothetical protein